MKKYTGQWWEALSEKAWDLYMTIGYREVSYELYCYCVKRRVIAFDNESII